MAHDSFPILGVRDLGAAVTFYGRLGFVTTYAFPADGDPVYVTVERDGRSIGIAAGDAERVAYWVYVDDVDRSFRELVEGGAPPVEAPRDEPWGERVASVRDPDGNVVHLGQQADDTVPGPDGQSKP